MATGAMGKAYDATWGRLFASFYDRALKASEENGLGDMRRALLADASGRVVEIGAGTGVNLDLYGAGVEDLTLIEPDPHMGAKLRERLEARGGHDSAPPARLVTAPAEAIPLPDDTFDTAVATLVLCTVPNPVAAVDELSRVLKPGGRLLFIEHVRAADPDSARWQDRFEKPWRFMADGCHCNRDTAATLTASSFEIESLDQGALPKSMPIVRPLISGTAALRGLPVQ
jgi:ubiquinone/menaquinone biosynthesis C-methylase UbiE